MIFLRDVIRVPYIVELIPLTFQTKKAIDFERIMNNYQDPETSCPGGEIGRRAGLKIQ